MLDAVGKLREHLVGNVGGRLADEVDADALGADELHRLHDFVGQLLGHIVEQQVRLVEEEHELGLGKIAGFGQKLVDFAEHPQQEHSVHLGRCHEFRSIQDVHRALARLANHQPVGDVQRRFAKEDVAARIFQGEQRSLDSAHRLRRHAAVQGFYLARMFRQVAEHSAQVLQVDEQHAVVVGQAEGDGQHAALHVGESQQPRKQVGPHIGNGDAHGHAVAAEHVPEAHIAAPRLPAVGAPGGRALAHLLGVVAGLGHAGDVALHVGHEHGHAGLGEPLGQHLHGDRLARARSARDEPVTIRLVQQQIAGVLPLRHLDLVAFEHRGLLSGRSERCPHSTGTPSPPGRTPPTRWHTVALPRVLPFRHSATVNEPVAVR